MVSNNQSTISISSKHKFLANQTNFWIQLLSPIKIDVIGCFMKKKISQKFDSFAEAYLSTKKKKGVLMNIIVYVNYNKSIFLSLSI